MLCPVGTAAPISQPQLPPLWLFSPYGTAPSGDPQGEDMVHEVAHEVSGKGKGSGPSLNYQDRHILCAWETSSEGQRGGWDTVVTVPCWAA